MIQAMAAAPANVANLQADTLSARQDAVRIDENDKGGVWIQYFGGKQKHTTAGNASYDLDVNGVMLGGDTRFMTEDGSWLAGVAMSSAKGDMTTMQEQGDTEGYSCHAYLSRQYNNGIFIDTAAQFGHYEQHGRCSPDEWWRYHQKLTLTPMVSVRWLKAVTPGKTVMACLFSHMPNCLR
ncbi:autotransporter outer membrane beta-barrel domain-containing protein [Escherichia coli]